MEQPGRCEYRVSGGSAAGLGSLRRTTTRLLPRVRQKFVRIGGLPTGVDEPRESIPTEFSLEQNYPNPFNPTTTLKFNIPHSAFVALKVYDALGREVSTLVNEVKPPGTYEVKWDAKGFASGMYIYRFQAGDFVATRKILLLR